MMHVKLWTAAENFHNFFPYNIRNLDPGEIIHFLQLFHATFLNITCHQNFVILITNSFVGVFIAPPERFLMRQMFFIM